MLMNHQGSSWEWASLPKFPTAHNNKIDHDSHIRDNHKSLSWFRDYWKWHTTGLTMQTIPAQLLSRVHAEVDSHMAQFFHLEKSWKCFVQRLLPCQINAWSVIIQPFLFVSSYESALFKSYFPVMEYLEGGAESGFRHVTPEQYKPRLFHFHGDRAKVEVR